MSKGKKVYGAGLQGIRHFETDHDWHDGYPRLLPIGMDPETQLIAKATLAAQDFFEFPRPDGKGRLVAAGAWVPPSKMNGMLGKKKIRGYVDRLGFLHLCYRELVVQFRERVKTAEARQLMESHGLICRRRLAGPRLRYVAAVKRQGNRLEDPLRVCRRLLKLKDQVEFATPDYASEVGPAHAMVSRAPSDPQWHLRAINAKAAWDMVPSPDKVAIALIDDGLDLNHDAFATNLFRLAADEQVRHVSFGRNFFFDDGEDGFDDAAPRTFSSSDPANAKRNDIHGTACAGLAAGSSTTVPGLCPNAKLLPLKIFRAGALTRRRRIADAIEFAASRARVILCAWFTEPDDQITSAIQAAASEDGDRLGTVFICAAGNGEGSGILYPANLPQCIAVGASTAEDEHPRYSNSGKELWVVAPSSHDPGTIDGIGVFTTDVTNPQWGFNNERDRESAFPLDLTARFGGTSASAAIVAGLVALMLSRRPDLRASAVKDILKRSTVAIGPENAYVNGHSTLFGYGRIDAQKALQNAIAFPST